MTESLKLQQVQDVFPELTVKNSEGNQLVYLDTAASALKPKVVIERLNRFYQYEASNVHRGAHFLSAQATDFYEQARTNVAHFLGAADAREIIFTRGTTESINLVAQAWGRQNLKAGDIVLLSEMEHHSNLIPWQMLAQEVGCRLDFIQVNPNGELDLDSFYAKLTPHVKLLSLVHCSNTLGTINPIEEMIIAAKKIGATVLIDGAQAVPCLPVDVTKLGCDFYAFSGHKLFGPYGIGVLYGKLDLLNSMPPYQGGGSMITEVSFAASEYNVAPYRFEAGTPNIAGALGLSAAIDFVRGLGFANIQAHEDWMLIQATERLKALSFVEIVGEADKKLSIVSMSFKGMHAADVGDLLSQQGIAVRVGHHCTQPLLKKLGYDSTLRASFSIYNTIRDVEALVVGLVKAQQLLT